MEDSEKTARVRRASAFLPDNVTQKIADRFGVSFGHVEMVRKGKNKSEKIAAFIVELGEEIEKLVASRFEERAN